jgi:serine/threonine-protein kinase
LATAQPTPSRARRRIGKYLVTGRIGRGGMGMVYRARDEALERDVAVKTLSAEGLLDDESRARFGIEAKAAARLQHPNIVTIFELGEERGQPFIAMELLPGADLETLLRSGEELLLEEKLDIVVQVGRGLAYAHQRGVVHRDMKPSNIRVLDDGRAKIMDFGIAKLGSTAVTKSGMMVGTVHYMSPEQIRGDTLDGRTDVFSLGVILYELLSGARPFPGDAVTQVLYRIVHEPHLPLRGDWGALTPRLCAIVDKALAKDVAQRYAGTDELADDVAEALRELRERSPRPADSEELATARRLLDEGRAQESLERLRALVAQHPDEIQARRALRTVQREIAGGRPAPPEEDEFPELDATFHAPPTQRATATLRQEVLAARGVRRGPLAAALALGALALVALLRSGPPPTPTVRLQVRSEPAGAAVLLDGRDTGVVTDGEVTLPARETPVRLTLRKAGYAEATRELRPPFSAGPLRFTLSALPREAVLRVRSTPAGAQVVLDGRERGRTPLSLGLDAGREHKLVLRHEGYQPHETTLAAGAEARDVDVTLVPRGPLGTIVVTSSYPLDVLWEGRVLARDQSSASVSVAPGRQALTLSAPRYFLRSTVAVQVTGGGTTEVQAPGLGRLNVRATPDNCEVLIGGVFADYPPILNREVAAGTLTVTFKWPDGTRRDETVTLAPGEIQYVTGRKD